MTEKANSYEIKDNYSVHRERNRLMIEVTHTGNEGGLRIDVAASKGFIVEIQFCSKWFWHRGGLATSLEKN